MAILNGITGGSGSGKSTLAETLYAVLPAGSAALLREESYYIDAAALPGFDAARFDFDDVKARDHDLLAAHLAELKAGRGVTAPMPMMPYQASMWSAVFQARVAIRSPGCTPQAFSAFDTRLARPWMAP